MDKQHGKKRISFKEGIALVTALVALFTALIALATAVLNIIYTHEQGRKIEQLEGCSGIIVKITEPSNGEEVGGRLYVNGVATPSDTCRYVFVVVRDKSGAVWKIADLVQTNAAGQWFGVVQLDDVSHVGSDLEIMAKVTSRPNDYTVGQFLSAPPLKGISSTNIIHIKRMR